MGDLDIIEDRNVAPSSVDFDPLPAGRYEMMVTSSEVKPTSNNRGLMLSVTCTVVGGEYEGRKVFHNFNIKNPSEKAQQIGLGMLSSLSRAVGLTEIPDDSAELRDKVFLAKVKLVAEVKDEATGKTYLAKNEITRFLPVGEVAKVEVSVASASDDEDSDQIPF